MEQVRTWDILNFRETDRVHYGVVYQIILILILIMTEVSRQERWKWGQLVIFSFLDRWGCFLKYMSQIKSWLKLNLKEMSGVSFAVGVDLISFSLLVNGSREWSSSLRKIFNFRYFQSLWFLSQKFWVDQTVNL